MDYGMAVRAHGTQVLNGIHLILRADTGEQAQVVNVNDTSALRPVDRLEIDLTYGAPTPIVRDTGGSRLRVTFVLVHLYSARRAFWVCFCRWNFIGVLTFKPSCFTTRSEGAHRALVASEAGSSLRMVETFQNGNRSSVAVVARLGGCSRAAF
jgi:hypothetical protein